MENPFSMPSILVVDDDRTILLLAQRTLSPIADVVTALSAEAGIAGVRNGQFNVVLLDI